MTTTERTESLDTLRSCLTPGDTVYTILRHVSRSGMQREISPVIVQIEGTTIESLAPGGKPTDYIRADSVKAEPLDIGYWAGRVLDLRHGKSGGLKIGGCGMDMGFHLVYELSSVLYRDGYACLGKGRCPSNYHMNHRNAVRCSNLCRREGTEGKRTFWNGTTEHVCTECEHGYLPNPDGPERFDLTHTDGYALRHKWL